MHGGVLGPRVLANHGLVPDGALDIGRGGGVKGGEGLGGEAAELVLVVAQPVDDEGQGARGLLGEQTRVLAREAGEEVVEGGEAGIDEGGVLRGGGGAQGFEEVGNGGVGNIVLLDAGLDGRDLVDFSIEGRVAAQDRDQVGDLLVGELVIGHLAPPLSSPAFCRCVGVAGRMMYQGAAGTVGQPCDEDRGRARPEWTRRVVSEQAYRGVFHVARAGNQVPSESGAARAAARLAFGEMRWP